MRVWACVARTTLKLIFKLASSKTLFCTNSFCCVDIMVIHDLCAISCWQPRHRLILEGTYFEGGVRGLACCFRVKVVELSKPSLQGPLGKENDLSISSIPELQIRRTWSMPSNVSPHFRNAFLICILEWTAQNQLEELHLKIYDALKYIIRKITQLYHI